MQFDPAVAGGEIVMADIETVRQVFSANQRFYEAFESLYIQRRIK